MTGFAPAKCVEVAFGVCSVLYTGSVGTMSAFFVLAAATALALRVGSLLGRGGGM